MHQFESVERRERERQFFESIGWHEITDPQEFEAISESFFGTFFSGTALQLPRPFTTWDVRHAETNSPNLNQFASDLHSKCLAALKSIEQPACWYVLENINHPWYRLELSKTPNHFDEWPIALLPNADPCYLIANDLKCGIVAETDRTISVFGQPLLAAVNDHSPLVLKQVKNQSDA